ncbi:PREDICTED: plasmalemma vesicle-associated protein [Dipodomys ordii]|uniref:Plasmalemma vesicle-associated protein n=1 Tax=Dipodomys ordii TaxID=10020 RepID=A0A1S3G693_DIPOR|nr:PREDICTED: plasmalemma vesicle-associated protein [Dipodomys ordii]
MGLAAERPFEPRGCWFYLRYFFLFASLTQLLVILGLVLFMVYGNPHAATEANLRATQARADALYGQVQDLGALRANLSLQLNLTAQARDAIMQLLLGARRDLDRINASFRQCQGEVVNYRNNEEFVVAVVLSEQRCLEELKEGNKSCEALRHKLEARAGALEAELARARPAAHLGLEAGVQGVHPEGHLHLQLRALEEKAALQAERDRLARELEARRREVDQLKMQVAFRVDALDTCLKAKTPPVVLPRPVAPAPQPRSIDSASLEDFKKKVLQSYRPPAAPASG